MSAPVKAVFFDIDGTLIHHAAGGPGEVPPSTLLCLAALRRKGIKLFVATGRIPSMVTFLKRVFPFDGYLTLNGQLALDGDFRTLYQLAHRPEDIRKLVELAGADPFPCLVIEGWESFCLAPSPEIQAHFARAGLQPPGLYDLSRLERHPVLQFLAYLPYDEALRRLAPLSHIAITCAGGTILDVIPRDGGKAAGIAALAGRYGWKREEIAAFGDGKNDAGMLAWAGVGVAMGNGAPEAKAAAGYVTTHVDRDGVQNALLHLGILTPGDLSQSA